jgi:aspartyl-tRNA(Asn)/glutamyl-tRNA(Gln) amidotransferase subunit A
MTAPTLAALSAGLKARQYSSVELTRAALARVERSQPQLNALVTVTAESALAAAAAADQRIAAGTAGPLTGVPMIHKDIFCTAGVRTTCGSRMLSNFISPYDAHIVTLLADAGMVMVGKANMDEFAMGSSNETSYFGPVSNPWDITRVPGGSSGGSAAAVAARLAPLATASDTGGSIRQPAALCGVTGIKPTYGRVSRYGMIAFASSLDQAGVITVSAEDAAMTLQAMSGYDRRDSTSIDAPVPDYVAELQQPLAGLRIGILKEFFGEGLSAAIEGPVREALATWQRLGATVREVSLPSLPLSVPTYYVVAPAEASSNLARFDGVRFGHRCDKPRDLIDLYKRSRAEGFGAEVKRRIMTGTYVLSAGYYDAYYSRAQKLRTLIARDFTEAYKKCDVILTPATPGPAFGVGAKTSDPLEMYLQDVFTVTVNLAGLPGISVPGGLTESGLPLGLQLIGKAFDEGTLLRAAQAVETAADFKAKPAKWWTA